MAKRLPDWEARLDGFLMNSMARSLPGASNPLEWNWNPEEGHNCASWTSDAIEQIIGFNIAKEFLSHARFGGPHGAMEAISSVWECTTFEGMWETLMEDVPLVMAQKGDIGLILSDDLHSKEKGFHHASGILSDPYLYVMQPGGIIRFPRSEVVRTFSVDSYVIPHRQDGHF